MEGSNQSRWCYNFIPNEANGSLVQVCMAFVGGPLKENKKVSLLFTEKEINNKMSIEDVKKIVEVGNSLIFPATISFGKFRNFLSFDSNDFNGLEVKLREKKAVETYERSDARCCLEGNIHRITVYERPGMKDFDIRIYVTTTKMEKGYSNYKGQTWQISQNDFVEAKTGKLLKDVIADKIKEKALSLMDKNVDDCIAITIDRDVMKSNMHMQAAMTYYRMIYSCKYSDVLYDMLLYIKQGCCPWKSLSYAYSKKDRDSYYGFSSPGFVFKDMDSVLNYLTKGNSINISFTNTSVRPSKQYLGQNVEDTTNKYVCIDIGKCKTLTLGKEYLCYPFLAGVQALCDDGVTRYISSAKFSKK